MSLMTLENDLQSILTKLGAQGYSVEELVFGPAASDAEILRLEEELGLSLPSSLRAVLATISGHLDFAWFALEELQFAAPFESNFSGALQWSLNGLRSCEASRQMWISTCFPDVTNDYDRVWHDKLAFQEVGNGDLIAVDLRRECEGKIVYLSHDQGEGHGLVLAPSFEDFVERSVALACTGGEDWQWLPFTARRVEGLDSSGDNARSWRALLQIA